MKLKSGAGGDLNGFLDAGSHMHGELRFEDTFRIDGRLTGKVISDGDLVVGVGGEIEGEVRVGRVFISGTVRGRIHATRRLEIATNGRVFADLETPSLVVEDGAFVEGACSMVAAGKAEVVAKPLAAVPLLKER
jgi:cytoskeletal protein CcmA (bactofilin family)